MVEGLRLQGAVLNSGRLEASMRTRRRSKPCPQCAWRGCRRTRRAPGAARGHGRRPAAARATVPHGDAREKAIAEVQLPVLDAEEGARWVLAGAARRVRRSGLKIG